MASHQETLDAVKAVLPDVTHRKMMGEYLLYRDGVLFGGIYDDRLLLKITKASASTLRDCPAAFPYEGGGEMILFPEPYDAPLLQKVVASMVEELRKSRRHSRYYVYTSQGEVFVLCGNRIGVSCRRALRAIRLERDAFGLACLPLYNNCARTERE